MKIVDDLSGARKPPPDKAALPKTNVAGRRQKGRDLEVGSRIRPLSQQPEDAPVVRRKMRHRSAVVLLAKVCK